MKSTSSVQVIVQAQAAKSILDGSDPLNAAYPCEH
jgi:hypothetical protein